MSNENGRHHRGKGNRTFFREKGKAGDRKVTLRSFKGEKGNVYPILDWRLFFGEGMHLFKGPA